jgi:transposase-like protein
LEQKKAQVHNILFAKKGNRMNLDKTDISIVNDILESLSNQSNPDLNPVIEQLLNLAALMQREKFIGVAAYERSEDRQGYANGFKPKTMHTRSGPLKLQVPQVRGGDEDFYPSCFEKGVRSERALKLTLAEMYVQGISTRKVKAVTEELCGMKVSSSQVSRASKLLDKELEKFRNRPLEGAYKYLFLDAHYEKVRHAGSVVSLAVLKAIGVASDGTREVLGVSASLSEAEVHWRGFLGSLHDRGLKGIELFTSDDHAGLKNALRAVFPSVPWQRCTFHLAQNAQAYAPKKSMKPEIAQVMRDIYNSPSLEEAREGVKRVIGRYAESAPKFAEWLEENAEEGFLFFKFDRSHWKKIRTVNVVERLHAEIRRRTRVARLFPNEESCLRLVSAVLQEIHEGWVSGRRYMKMEGE